MFLGTPEIAVPSLRALHAAGFDVALVVTGPDKRRGRRAEPTPTPVKAAAVELGLPVSHDLADVPVVGADAGVVVAFGRILRRDLLEALPMVNVHFSLLPRWRGAAPVERAILAGDDRTGVCVMAVEEGLDTGGVYARSEVAIGPAQTAEDLADGLAVLGADLLVETLQDGLGEPEPQVGETTYASKLGSEDLRLRWEGSAVDAERVVRVGGAWTTFRGKRLKVRSAQALDLARTATEPGELVDDVVATGHGGLRLLVVQPEGKGPVPFRDWANGARPEPGERLGQDA